MNTSAASASWLFPFGAATATTGANHSLPIPAAQPGSLFETLDLTPAQWIWYPSGRVLQNTFVLFRKAFTLKARPTRATGWILGDSRYALWVNDQPVQWGPAPSDPRWSEADPLDLTGLLQAGENVIGAQVLFYGQGDGTWPIGKPGFIFRLDLRYEDGSTEQIVSDSSWQAHLARSWKPGQYKRWYLRALQEEFDARLYPYGWTSAGFNTSADWLPAMNLKGRADRPAICTDFGEYQFEIEGNEATTALRRRHIPAMQHNRVPVARLRESAWLTWKRPPVEYFESLTPDAFEVRREEVAKESAPETWLIPEKNGQGALLTFELAEQVVGWPYFTIEAPAGTTIELLVHEGHQPGGAVLLNTHFHSWTRFVCREGVNHFEPFDFESLRWLQFHIHNYRGNVTLREVGVRRRQFPWPKQPVIECSDERIRKVLQASVNTLHNCAQETLVDGMGRERQQYSGDCGHQLHAIFHAFGETRLPARYCNTYSQGNSLDGWFMDSWPAYDRLARVMERQMQLTNWGPILDHSVGFNFDCYYYYLHTGDKESLAEAFPRLLRFCDYLGQIVGNDGLLPVENLGIPSVWIDHEAYKQQKHKQCALNLYAAAMLEHALPYLCRAFGEEAWAKKAAQFGASLRQACVTKYWDADRKVFVNNRPWMDAEKEVRTCDRSLATAVLFDQCPGGVTAPAIAMLNDCPPEMGFSYPANAVWRMWALAKGGRVATINREIRERWSAMESVRENNTLQENWRARYDGRDQWSHCPIGPLVFLYQGIAGIQPLEPGFTRCRIEPQLGDLDDLHVVAHTVKGPIELKTIGRKEKRQLRISVPPGCEAELVLNARGKVSLPRLGEVGSGKTRYRLSAGTSITVAMNT